jgi:hypothetical protein
MVMKQEELQKIMDEATRRMKQQPAYLISPEVRVALERITKGEPVQQEEGWLDAMGGRIFR